MVIKGCFYLPGVCLNTNLSLPPYPFCHLNQTRSSDQLSSVMIMSEILTNRHLPPRFHGECSCRLLSMVNRKRPFLNLCLNFWQQQHIQVFGQLLSMRDVQVFSWKSQEKFSAVRSTWTSEEDVVNSRFSSAHTEVNSAIFLFQLLVSVRLGQTFSVKGFQNKDMFVSVDRTWWETQMISHDQRYSMGRCFSDTFCQNSKLMKVLQLN